MAELSYLTVSLFHHAGERSALLLNLSHTRHASHKSPHLALPALAWSSPCAGRLAWPPNGSAHPDLPPASNPLAPRLTTDCDAQVSSGSCLRTLPAMQRGVGEVPSTAKEVRGPRVPVRRAVRVQASDAAACAQALFTRRAGGPHRQVGGSDHGNLPHQEGDRNRSGRCQRGPRGEGQREASARQRAE